MYQKPLVSIIVPVRNEEKDIEECLNSIRKQSYRNIEIIVVDGGSKDNTVEIALKNGARVISERPAKSPGNARNVGAKAASGEILSFVDADNVMGKHYIKKSVDFLLKNKKIHGISTNTIMYPTKELIPNLYFTERLSAKKGLSPTIIWRDIFLKVLFDPTLGFGEDYDMSRRFIKKGFKYQFLKNIKIYHKEPNFKRIVTESRWWGRTYWVLLKKWHMRTIASFVWMSVVAFLLPLIILSYFLPFISSIVSILVIVFLIHSFLKILSSLHYGAKCKYAVLLPLFKIFRYSFLFIGFLLSLLTIRKKNRFGGE